MARLQALNFIPLPQSHPCVELQQSFRSQIQDISPFLQQLMQFIQNFRFTDGSEAEIELSIREALVNAVVHGNGESFFKRVYVQCRCYLDGELSITVRDEGNGFDRSIVPDPTKPENRLSSQGRGIYLMEALMDDVSFEENGTVVRLWKRPQAKPSAPRRAR